jgi:hypothetical protein
MQKFDDSYLFFALKSIIYFNEAEQQEEPLMFDPISWNQVKSNIIKAHLEYLKNH